ncbi:MAG: F0F1 ATP synthase subunit epsilon [Planctomycetaceae bacterium]
MTSNMMQLRVSTPDRIVLEDVAARIIAEAENGAFCLLPRHRDFATALLPGLFEYTTEDGGQRFLAVDEGLLVKSGIDVSVSTRHAVVSQDLQSLMRVVEEEFTELDDRERAARAAVARLEADFARRFLTLREHEHG